MTGLRIGVAESRVSVASARPVWRGPLPLLRVAALLGTLANAALAAAPTPPFELVPPVTLRGPHIATSLMGTTYTYLPPGFKTATRLMITTMPAAAIRQRLGELSDVQCIQLFLAELRATHERFFVVAMREPLALGPVALTRYRWNGDSAGRAMTGVLACGRVGSDYYVIHFADTLATAMRTFPAIRASLKTMRPIAAGHEQQRNTAGTAVPE